MKGIHPAIWLIGAAIYVVLPLDGDFLGPVFWIDDLIVVLFSIKKFCEEMEGPGPGQPGRKPIDALYRAAPPKIQSPLDLLVTAKGNPNLN